MWLDRALVRGPFLFLATNEAEFRRAMRHLKVAPHEQGTWITPNADATTHTLNNPEGSMCCVVSINARPGHTGIQIAAMLVHEAVHVFQKHCDRIGESNPSEEFEAYAIQGIAQRLMTAFGKRVGRDN